MYKLFCSALAAAALTATTLAAPAFADDAAPAAPAPSDKLAKHVDNVFARLDADNDGKISKAEASKGPRMAKKFDQIDADHDGFVTKAELSAALAARHANAKK